MLSCVGVSKAYGALVVVRNVSLEVPGARRHAIIGPNGAGKTTLFNLIHGVVAADSGTISINGNDVTKLPPEKRARRGLSRSFQRNSCFLESSVGENLAIGVCLAEGLEWRTARSAARFPKVRARIEEIAERVGIADRLETPARLLSYGTQRQLEVGLALAAEPNVLLLDEPTAGMSPKETERIQRLIEELPGSLTVVIIEHDMDIVFSLADRITVMDAGAVLLEGTPQEVRSSTAVQTRYLGEALA